MSARTSWVCWRPVERMFVTSSSASWGIIRPRRTAGIGTFPILNYDDLTASQIADRVTDLTPAELRKVRDYEKRNANRKSVLDAIARRLS